MLTREQARALADGLPGAVVQDARVDAGVIILELAHRGTDDGRVRLIVSAASLIADRWPWPGAHE